MKRYLVILFLILYGLSAFGQSRKVSVIFENRMFNYTVTRYSPAWEIQSESQKPVLSENSKLFKKVEDNNVDNLKSLLYSKGFVPKELNGGNGNSMEKYLASKRLVIHYRIQYREHVIFIAHINNSSTRSVIPFKVESGKWLLDPSFADSELFGLLAQPYFDVYTGVFNGQAYSYLAFEEIEKNGGIYDYSGHAINGKSVGGTIVNGRIGGAFKLGQGAKLQIDLVGKNNLNGDRFSLDGHLNIADSYSNTDKKRVIFTVEKQSVIIGEVYVENGFFNVHLIGADEIRVPVPKSEIWFHFAVKQAGKKLSLEIDGEELDAKTITRNDIIEGSRIVFGGEQSIKGSLDEFRIAK
ncbi:MAG: hypothetical protein K9G46_11750 [Flavobacteriales bacterium]|nr:hypothetical protein [Flavobacteriales bacterium]